MTTLVLVDDHTMLREGLREKFSACREISVVGEAGTAEALMKLLATSTPHVIILDIKLPDTSGFDIIKQIKRVAPRCKVVVLTMYNQPHYALHALECGADAFVVKGAPFDELRQAITAVVHDKTYVCNDLSGELLGRLRHPHKGATLDALSRREFEVLTLLGAGLSLKEAGRRMGIKEKTVSTYRARLMEKLNLTTTVDLVRLALETGVVD
jgi:two-component system, NarL family, invasion response regulator UvrY